MLIRHLLLWLRAALVVGATVWIAHRSALNAVPRHDAFYLLVIGGFLVSTLPSWSALRT